ncbi:hypothetical protein SKAU_G00057150 [Synaphobranchus kaupii]|uniref:Uncharacterized protein n=1 Tax=Synaphobranchus kaupii TaxID=118154 RepID=A0A9Q1JAC9_SYNKA|nr:hypothetical protein SKAU_G00057150 [Synaphobranchus kaupii]
MLAPSHRQSQISTCALEKRRGKVSPCYKSERQRDGARGSRHGHDEPFREAERQRPKSASSALLPSAVLRHCGGAGTTPEPPGARRFSHDTACPVYWRQLTSPTAQYCCTAGLQNWKTHPTTAHQSPSLSLTRLREAACRGPSLSPGHFPFDDVVIAILPPKAWKRLPDGPPRLLVTWPGGHRGPAGAHARPCSVAVALDSRVGDTSCTDATT